MESELAILNSQVYDEQMNQINCKQQIVEQKDLLEDLNQEVDSLKQRIGDMQERKATLNQKVEGLTEQFVEEVKSLRKDLDDSTAEMTRFG